MEILGEDIAHERLASIGCPDFGDMVVVKKTTVEEASSPTVSTKKAAMSLDQLFRTTKSEPMLYWKEAETLPH